MNEITEQLWVSDIDAARTEPTNQFDRVVTMCQDSVENNVGCDYYHHALADSPEAEDRWHHGEYKYSVFEAGVDDVLDGLENGETVLVHCHAGQNRSVATAIAALSVYHDEPPSRTREWVREARPQVHPTLEMLNFADEYVDRNI